MEDNLIPPGYEDDAELEEFDGAADPTAPVVDGAAEGEDDDIDGEPAPGKPSKPASRPWLAERKEMRERITALEDERKTLQAHLIEASKPRQAKEEPAKPAAPPRKPLNGDALLDELAAKGEDALSEILSGRGVVTTETLKGFMDEIRGEIRAIGAQRERENTLAGIVAEHPFLADTKSPEYRLFMAEYEDAVAKDESLKGNPQVMRLIARNVAKSGGGKGRRSSRSSAPLGTAFGPDDEDDDTGLPEDGRRFMESLAKSGVDTKGLPELARDIRRNLASMRRGVYR